MLVSNDTFITGIEVFGKFNDLEINTIVDKYNRYWFTAIMVADALGIGRTTINGIKKNNKKHFVEGEEYVWMVVDGKRQLVFSEEGFLTICDLAKSPVAFVLRRWMRKQFRVKKDEAQGIVVYPKHQELDDFSDVDPSFAAIQKLLDRAVENRRRIKALEASKKLLDQHQEELGQRMGEAERKIKDVEGRTSLNPGEMTALQLARNIRWVTVNGGVHNLAVILAAINSDFLRKGLLKKISSQGPNGLFFDEYVFTVDGVVAFKSKINSRYNTGDKFVIVPNEIAKEFGYKCKRNVEKC